MDTAKRGVALYPPGIEALLAISIQAMAMLSERGNFKDVMHGYWDFRYFGFVFVSGTLPPLFPQLLLPPPIFISAIAGNQVRPMSPNIFAGRARGSLMSLGPPAHSVLDEQEALFYYDWAKDSRHNRFVFVCDPMDGNGDFTALLAESQVDSEKSSLRHYFMETEMTDEDRSAKGLIDQLVTIHHQMSELQERENELVDMLGMDLMELSMVLGPRLAMIYAGPHGTVTWVPGLIPPSELPQGNSVESDFDWLKNFVHPKDFPELEHDLKAFASGLVTSICRRFRINVVGEMTFLVDFYLVATRRDEKKIPVECAFCFRPIGRADGLGSTLRQVMISVVTFLDSLREEDSPLASLFESRYTDTRDSSEKTIDKAWLGLAVVTAEIWRLQKSWELSFVKDSSMKYVWVSGPFAETFGLSLHEMQGRSDCELFHMLDEADEERIGEAVVGGRAVHCQRTRIVGDTPWVFRDSLWPVPEVRGSEARWILGVSSLVDAKETELGGHRSRVMVKVMEKALAAAKSDGIVLLTGESGSGKDHLAQYIHDHSERAEGPCFSINCAAIPEEMAESELFGHEKGAFTGAHKRKRGLLELAEGGTLLLNEIGDLSLRLQAKLLTFLDTRKFTRVGGEKEISVNARLIAATNKDLEVEVQDGRFRKDLFYRINILFIPVPPLRERLEDLPQIAADLLKKLATGRNMSEPPGITAADMEAMRQYPWPGNIRELQNVLERSMATGKSVRSILLGTAPQEGDTKPAETQTGTVAEGHTSGTEDWSWTTRFCPGRKYNELLEDLERALFAEALKRTGGDKAQAARLLGTARETVSRKLDRMGIDRDYQSRDTKA